MCAPSGKSQAGQTFYRSLPLAAPIWPHAQNAHGHRANLPQRALSDDTLHASRPPAPVNEPLGLTSQPPHFHFHAPLPWHSNASCPCP